MKRKLSLAMAFVSKPKVIILDEPTSGLDAQSRKEVKKLIQKLSKGRIVIFATQHLEDANELSDRIMILKQGKIVEFGSIYYIKSKHGVGYKILIRMKQETDVLLNIS